MNNCPIYCAYNQLYFLSSIQISEYTINVKLSTPILLERLIANMAEKYIVIWRSISTSCIYYLGLHSIQHLD